MPLFFYKSIRYVFYKLWMNHELPVVIRCIVWDKMRVVFGDEGYAQEMHV